MNKEQRVMISLGIIPDGLKITVPNNTPECYGNDPEDGTLYVYHIRAKEWYAEIHHGSCVRYDKITDTFQRYLKKNWHKHIVQKENNK